MIKGIGCHGSGGHARYFTCSDRLHRRPAAAVAAKNGALLDAELTCRSAKEQKRVTRRQSFDVSIPVLIGTNRLVAVQSTKPSLADKEYLYSANRNHFILNVEPAVSASLGSRRILNRVARVQRVEFLQSPRKC